VPTPKAFSLLFALRHFGVSEITSPELTGDWEFKLKQMESGQLRREEFMEHIESVTRDMVTRIRDGDIPDTAFAVLDVPCPKCGAQVQENYRKFQCQQCDFSLWKVLSGREWVPEEMSTLIRERSVGPITGFRSKMGRPFAAVLKLNDEYRLEFDFGQDRLDGEGDTPPDFTGQTSLGACPKCHASVFDTGMAYVCEKAVGAARTCDFRSGKIILQQTIELAQMEKLLSTGKTDLLNRFISKKNRPFKAYLVKTPGGKIGFEFEPRAPKKGKTTKTANGQTEQSVDAVSTNVAKKKPCRKTTALNPDADDAD